MILESFARIRSWLWHSFWSSLESSNELTGPKTIVQLMIMKRKRAERQLPRKCKNGYGNRYKINGKIRNGSIRWENKSNFRFFIRF